MTPAKILKEAKSRFMVLYHKDQETLNRLLYQALGKFQDKAGVIMEVWFDEPTCILPPLFHGVAGCCDNRRRYIAHRLEKDENENSIVKLKVNSRHQPPFCMSYFCNLRKLNIDEELPGDCGALITDYLEALIAIINTKREREAYLQADMNEAAQTLPSEQELRQRVTELETEMEENKAIIPPASMF